MEYMYTSISLGLHYITKCIFHAIFRNNEVTPQEIHQEAVNQEAVEASQAAGERNTEEMKQQALWQREEIRKQVRLWR